MVSLGRRQLPPETLPRAPIVDPYLRRIKVLRSNL